MEPAQLFKKPLHLCEHFADEWLVMLCLGEVCADCDGSSRLTKGSGQWEMGETESVVMTTGYGHVNDQAKKEMPYGDISIQIDSLPPLPCSLERLLGIMQDENSSASDLESLIRHDEALCAKILRMANSAFYGLRCRVKTLSRAIMTIGFHEVKSICLFNLLMDSFPVRGNVDRSHRERLWKHVLMTARHAAEIACLRPWVSKDEAYDLGLLHDLGWLAMLVHFKDDYQIIHQIAADRGIPLYLAEERHELTHTQIGKWIALRWGLPEVYHRVIAYHHVPEESPSHRPAVKIVSLAHLLAHMREYPDLVESGFVETFRLDLRISRCEWQGHLGNVERVRQEVDRLWRLLN